MELLIVVDGCEALLQDIRVEEWVQSVTGDRQGVDLSWEHASVLLRGQVL